MSSNETGIIIRRWSEVCDPAAMVAAIDRIFFAASNTRTFASEAERTAFRERWLGRYLEHDPSLVHLAMDRSGHLAGPVTGPVAGYLVGSLDDPAQNPRFADIGYFQALAEFTREYPAQIHVNVDAAWREAGIGARLIEAFADVAREAGTPGMHVVTGKGMRNVRFYERAGFSQLACLAWNKGEIVMLGRRLSSR